MSMYKHIWTYLWYYAASYRRTLMLRSVVNYANNSAGNVSGCERRSIHRLVTGDLIIQRASRGWNRDTQRKGKARWKDDKKKRRIKL